MKGITPVIAIVLLLLITVGAVGVVYTQFQGLVGGNEAKQDLQQRRQLMDVSLDTVGVTNSSSDSMNLYIKNVGDQPVNSSDLTLRIGYDGAKPVPPSVFNSQNPSLAKSPVSYKLSQGGTEKVVQPYEGSGDGNSFYPGVPQEENDQAFALALYSDTNTGKDYLIFNNRHSNSDGMEIDIQQIPASATVTRTDDSGEIVLSNEPEGNWGWVDCCNDGGIIDLGGSWSKVEMETISGPSNLKFFQKNDQRHALSYSTLSLVKENNPGCFTSASNRIIKSGDTFECQTGFKLPPVGKDMVLQVTIDGIEKSWEYTCRRDRTSESSC